MISLLDIWNVGQLQLNKLVRKGGALKIRLYYNEEKIISHCKYFGLSYHKKFIRNGTEHHTAIKKTVWVWGW